MESKQRSIKYRALFRAQFTADYFVWVDETGSDARNHIQKYGYALRGIAPTYFAEEGEYLQQYPTVFL